MGERPLTHEEARDLLGLYVIGGLEAGEEWEVARHLSDCPECRDEEREVRRVHEHLSELSAETVEPPPELKNRVMGLLPRKRRLRLAPLIAAAAAICVLAALTFIPGLIGDEEVAAASLNPTEIAPEAGGELEVQSSDPNVQAKLEVWNLPKPAPDEYYELWFGKGEGRVSAGTFTVDADGRSILYVTVPDKASSYQRVGITLEKFPREPRMSSAKVVLGGELQDS